MCLAVYFLRSNEATRALAPVPVADLLADGGVQLALDHADRSERGRRYPAEQSIKIHN